MTTRLPTVIVDCDYPPPSNLGAQTVLGLKLRS